MPKRNKGDDHLLHLSGSFGSVKVREMKLEHYSIISFQGNIVEPGLSLSITRMHEFLGLCFNLQEEHFAVGKNKFNMLYVPDAKYLHPLKKGTYSMLSLAFEPAYLKIWAQEFPIINTLLAKARSGIPAKISKMNLPVAPHILSLTREILHNTCTGSEKETFVKAWVMDILKGCLDQIMADTELLKLTLSKDDIEKITRVRQYVLQHLERDLSISMIAGKAGLDESVLTKGFKLVFGVSLQYFLLEEKMKSAKSLLLGTNIPLHKIAAGLGYKDFSHFSRVFRKKFGHTPRSLRQQSPGEETAGELNKGKDS